MSDRYAKLIIIDDRIKIEYHKEPPWAAVWTLALVTVFLALVAAWVLA